MKKPAKKACTGAFPDNNPPSYDELSDWSGFKGVIGREVIGRGYKQAVPNPSLSLDRFIFMLEKSLNEEWLDEK
jgi:hypothetical protein